MKFQTHLQPLHHEHVVKKYVPDAFVHTGLERWLDTRGITHLVIVGVSTNNSVVISALTADSPGLTTIVRSDATFIFDKIDFSGTDRSAEDVHLMALANLHFKDAEVMSCKEVLRRLGLLEDTV